MNVSESRLWGTGCVRSPFSALVTMSSSRMSAISPLVAHFSESCTAGPIPEN